MMLLSLSPEAKAHVEKLFLLRGWPEGAKFRKGQWVRIFPRTGDKYLTDYYSGIKAKVRAANDTGDGIEYIVGAYGFLLWEHEMEGLDKR